MFGGVGFLLNGNMLVGVWKDSLIVRLGPDKPRKPFWNRTSGNSTLPARAMKRWAMVAPEGVEDDDQLKDWISGR